jgi:arabinose-5-phosphate isomerase
MKKINHLESARKTINLEAEGLKNLAKTLNIDFSILCDYLLTTKGRIICLGVGKSGHIANKISATLSSTGSPAFFVSAAEALHGDVGAITKKDSVIIFSHSGESDEVINLFPTLRNIKCNVFSVTGNPRSTISQQSKINIDTGVLVEACPLDLAPTTSTTAALAIGDAIAVALLEAKDFKSDDFAKSHPGGKLGKRLLLKVKDIMHQGKEMPKVLPTTYLSEVLVEISSKGLGIAAIIDTNNKLKGVFTDGDLRRAMHSKLEIHKTKITEVMSNKVKTIDESALATKAIEIMQMNEIYVLVALDETKKPSGIIRMHDLLKSGLV